MKLLGKVSILHSLLLFALLTSGVGLVLVCGAFYLYDNHDFREKKVGELTATVDLLGSSSNSALAFDDADLGNQVLDSMRVHPGIRSAVLYKETGQVFAWYVRRDLTGRYVPPTLPPAGVNWASDFLSFSEPVFLEAKPVGRIYVEEVLEDVKKRQVHFAWITAMMALACMALVFLLSLRLRRTIARPILELADIAREIAAGKSYSRRAPQGSKGELGQLGKDFNHMLSEIERRDAELMEARDTLEQRVADRTQKLLIRIKIAGKFFGICEQGDKRIPGEHEPRNQDSAEWRDWHDRPDTRYQFAAGTTRVPGNREDVCGLAPDGDQRYS